MTLSINYFSSIVVPDFKGETLDKSMVLRYNFRSMVMAEVRQKEMLCNSLKSNHNGRPTPTPTSLHTSNRLFQKAVASATASTATTPTSDETVAKTAPPPSAPSTPTKTAPFSTPHDILKGDFFSWIFYFIVWLCLCLIINLVTCWTFSTYCAYIFFIALLGFAVYIKPDVHLDEMIPICARDQHLLFNIFGEKWTSPVVISAYIAIKGQTGFMHNWSNGDSHHA